MRVRKILSMVLVVSMVMGLLILPVEFVSANTWTGNTDNQFAGGDGSEESPYQIATGAQLAYLASLVNAENANYNAVHYILTDNIDLANIAWTPIGYGKESSTYAYSNFFKGVFDGNGKIIFNISVTVTKGYSTVGLFGTLGGGANIKNLGIEGVTVTYNSNGTYFGAVAGYVNGSVNIDKCYVHNVRASRTGTPTGILGGLLGRVQTDTSAISISDCYTSSVGNMSIGTWRGGMVGLVYSASSITFTNCYTDYSYFGSCNNTITKTISNCYYLTDGTYTDTISNATYISFGTGITKADLKGFATTLGSAFKTDTVGINNGYPLLVWEIEPAADISWYNTTDSTFSISTANQLRGLSYIVNGTAFGITQDDFLNKTIMLTADVDLENEFWKPIGYNEGSAITTTKQFKGTFDGNGHIIGNLKINLPNAAQYDTLGLFGTIGGGAHIKDVGIDNFNVSLRQYNTFIGGLVGLVAGNANIEGCYVTNSTITTLGIAYSGILGGLIGRVQAVSATLTVANCYTSGINYHMIGNYRGGIVGLVHTDTSSVSFTNCYTTYISFGNGAKSTADNCYYATDTSSDTGIADATYPQFCTNGVTSAILKGYATALGTAFENDSYNLNGGYPILVWQQIIPEGYAVTLADVTGGTAAFDADTLNYGHVAAGSIVTVTVTPDYAWLVANVSYGTEQATKEGDNIYSFIMPANAVTVTVTMIPPGVWANQIKNGNMEDISDKSMYYDGNSGNNLSYASETELTGETNHVLVLNGSWEKQPVLARNLHMVPGKVYYCSADVKLIDKSGNVGYSYSGGYIDNMLVDANKWTKVSYIFKVPEDATNVADIRFFLNEDDPSYTMYLDNWEFYECEPTDLFVEMFKISARTNPETSKQDVSVYSRIRNYSGQNRSAAIIVAAYNAADELVGVATVYDSLVSGEIADETKFSIPGATVSFDASAVSFKAFIWESLSNMRPLRADTSSGL